MPTMLEYRVIYDGLVQGVFFRKTICRHAHKHKVVGTVKNLDDGSVEMVIQGEEEVLEHLLAAIDKDHKPAQIEKVEKKIQQPLHKYIDFEIIY